MDTKNFIQSKFKAFPSWDQCRLLIPQDTIKTEWLASDRYPSQKFIGILRKKMLQIGNSLGFTKAKYLDPSNFAYVSDVCDKYGGIPICIFVGGKNKYQKKTILFTDESGTDLFYLKTSSLPDAIKNIQNEYYILQNYLQIPEIISYYSTGETKGILVKAISGHTAKICSQTEDNIWAFSLQKIDNSEQFTFEDHPWMRKHNIEINKLCSIKTIHSRKWGISLFHGDFSPWNIIQSTGNEYIPIDWEYGDPQGFPYLDYIYYQMQKYSFIRNMSSDLAYNKIKMDLHTRGNWLTQDEISGLLFLASSYACSQRINEGYEKKDSILKWRMKFMALSEGMVNFG